MALVHREVTLRGVRDAGLAPEQLLLGSGVAQPPKMMTAGAATSDGFTGSRVQQPCLQIG
jgi:hypothetical protein